MQYGKVIEVSGETALVLFECLGVQKRVKISKHIEELKAEDEVAVAFETEMIKGIILGVCR